MPLYSSLNPRVPAGTAEGRLTVSSSVSLPQGGGSVSHANTAPDVDTDNSSGTLYYTPYVGNRISIFDGTQWNMEVFPASTSLSLLNALANETFDVFGFMNGGPGGTFAMERVAWGTNTAYNISGVTVGATTTITFTEPGGTQPFVVGDIVEIKDTNGTAGTTILHGAWAVSAVGGSGTTRTVDLASVTTTGLTYTGGGTIRKNKNTRTTALAVQDGIYVKSGDPTRKYLGTFRTTGENNLTIDNRTKRFVWNYYNRCARSILKIEQTNTWTYGTSTWRAMNNRADNRLEFVTGMAEDTVTVSAAISFRGPAPSAPPTESQFTVINSAVVVGIAVNNNLANNVSSNGIGYLCQMTRDAYNSLFQPGYATMQKSFDGYNFLTATEWAYSSRAATTCEIVSYLAGVRSGGITGVIYG
jgi:hypothetical protein